MVNPVTKLTIDASPLGFGLEIYWELPAELPDNYKLYLFKKSGSALSQTVIDDYFTNINDQTVTNELMKTNGAFVFDKLETYVKVVGDILVKNDLVYYYSVVIRDETTAEYSAAVTEHQTPQCLINSDIEDGKDIVVKAIDKMFDTTIRDKKTKQKIDLKKEIDVIKQFSSGTIHRDTIMIERINGAETMRFWGDMMNQYKNMIVLGGADTDVIRMTYITDGGPDRRDTLNNIFRARKYWLRLMIKRLKAKDVSITIEGDYYNPTFHGENVIGFTIVFAMIVELKMKYELPEITQHITQMEIE